MLGWIKKTLRKWLEVEVPPLSTPIIGTPSISPPVVTPPEKLSLPEGIDLFQPEERLIFKYFDGSTTLVKADPLVLYRKMMEIGPQLSIDISVARSEMNDANKAYDAMLQKMRDIFSVNSFEKGGLTESETVALFDKFNAYCEEIQKKTKRLVTSQTETPDSSPSYIPGGRPTTSGAASGSTRNVPSTAGPQQPSTATPSPMA